ncbi:YqgQ family protein [Pseudalkalibacillus hwajinpoensis]|uniref:YqgQ family protein n=1 Tax=Guptibacillus hwajinpoensis TaxID=208199 RepID=UPI00325BC817
MKTFFDVQQLLKRFGMIVYTGSRLGDLELMEEELKELYEMKILEQDNYLVARMILRNEIGRERDKHERNN